MSHPSYAMQAAMIAALKNDAALTALLGGPHIFESVPANKNPPWVVFDDISVRANDVTGARGHVHRIILDCVSDQPGTRQCSAVAERVSAVLHDASLTLTGQTLVNLSVAEMSLRRSGKKPYRIMAVRLRAVTEIQI